ncbi:MAG: hypothetical protein HKN09_02855 [Saprospiraceae bacterium]|nr:hypothetical protein [Saprospiraceae bacterium]
MFIQKAINHLKSSPKKLFWIDGLGALCSAFLLAVVLANLESIFGIPSNALYFLATFPIIFSIYDFACYNLIKDNYSSALKCIAGANTIYCVLSIGVAFTHKVSLTKLGWAYLVFEIFIVLTLAYIEFKIATESSLKQY